MLLIALTLLLVVNLFVYLKNNQGERLTGKFTNVYILSGSDKGIYAYVKGQVRKFKVNDLDGKINTCIGDLDIKDGYVVKAYLKKDKIRGKVNQIDQEGIDIDGYGKRKFADGYQIYKSLKNVSLGDTTDLITGYDIADFYLDGDNICGAVVTSTVHPYMIRVLLNTTGYKGYYHSSVKLTSEGSYTITNQSTGQTVKKKAKADFELSVTDAAKNTEYAIIPDDKAYPIQMLSIERDCGNPEYSGVIYVRKEAQGFLIINEVDIENYLKGVVVSEMPSSYGKIPLDVQAICARTYAMKRIYENSYGKYGAHLEDSTSSQVYNNVRHTAQANNAVDDTNGKIITCDGKPIDAFFYSTSCGVGTDESIWNQADVKYLSPKCFGDEIKLNLSDNDDFLKFIKNDYASIDRAYPYYRWSFHLSKKQLNLKMRNFYQSAQVGNITNLEVTKRGANGIALSVRVTGDKGTKDIDGELEIRKFLNPYGVKTQLSDGSARYDLQIMLSAYVAIVPAGDGFDFYGGGYGHGVGMSQNGTKSLAAKGKSVKEIISYYYDHVEITQSYNQKK